MADQNTTALANKAPKRSYFQMRKIALDNSVPKNEQAMEEALKVLREFVLDPKNAARVWLSAKVAHSAAGMTEQECIDCLLHLGKKPAAPNSGAGAAMQDDPDAIDPTKDIYRQLGLQEWVKYLYYGGERKIGTDANGNALYAKDQDVVMHYFGIETHYEKRIVAIKDKDGNVVKDKDGKEKTREKQVLWCDYSRSLSPMLDLRNKFAGHTNVTKEEALQLSELMGYYGDLLACLKPLTDTYWAYQPDCQEMMDRLRKDFYGALGAQIYQVADIMNMMYTNRQDKWLDFGKQPQLEDLLVKAGMQVSEGAVEIVGELNDFLPALEKAWGYYTLCKISGVEQLKHWLDVQDPDRAKQVNSEDKTAAALAEGSPTDWTELAERYQQGVKGVERDMEQAKAWFEKAATAASPDPKAMYALGQIYEQQEKPVFAKQYYSMAADKGYAPAQVRMGVACEDGLYGQSRNWKAAFAWYEKAAKQMDTDGLYRLAMCYEAGRGVEQNKSVAISYYKMAQSQGSQEAVLYGVYLQLVTTYEAVKELCETMRKKSSHKSRAYDAFSYLPQQKQEEYDSAWNTLHALAKEGISLAQEKVDECFMDHYEYAHPEQAKAWYENAISADAPDPEALYTLGRIYERRDPAVALSCYRKAAECGLPQAQILVGIHCERGTYKQTRNWEEAARWYEAAADGNDPAGLYYLGHCYETGCGKPKKYKTAASYYAKAAELGSDDAKAAFARLQLYGNGMPKDAKAAIRTLQELVKGGSAPAHVELGICYLKGIGVTVDAAAGFQHIQQAAQAGDINAFYYMGGCYEEGKGTEPDKVTARQWYMRAARQGHCDAQVRCAFRAPQGLLWMWELADQNYAPAQVKLARWCLAGEKGLTEERLWEAKDDGTTEKKLARRYLECKNLSEDHLWEARDYGTTKRVRSWWEPKPSPRHPWKEGIRLLNGAKDSSNEAKWRLAHWYMKGSLYLQEARDLAQEVAEQATGMDRMIAEGLLANSYRKADDRQWLYWADRAARSGHVRWACKLVAFYSAVEWKSETVRTPGGTRTRSTWVPGVNYNIDKVLNYLTLAAEHGNSSMAWALADFYQGGNAKIPFQRCSDGYIEIRSDGSRKDSAKAQYWREVQAKREQAEKDAGVKWREWDYLPEKLDD